MRHTDDRSPGPIRDLEELRTLLDDLDGRGYKAYKTIRGRYHAAGFELAIEHVQGDPFADPSRLRVYVPPETAKLPDWAYDSPTHRVATADYLNRVFHRALQRRGGARGSGRSGELRVLRPGQQVLERTGLTVDGHGAVEARFRAGLPARGRTILGRQAADLLTVAVPAAVEEALRYEALNADRLRTHVETVEDARSLRDQLDAHGLVAFVADGSILPRLSGVGDRPLPPDRARPFLSPPELRVTLHAPHAGAVTGMGIPKGVTLIVGGGYHGKSTLLQALELGIYDHAPGDGRERVVTVPTAVKVQAESGRSVAGTDIANFIDRLPGGEDTSRFRTPNASGSTSQAAAIIEALEVGATCLLMDEDTSATNFLIRDARMQRLVPDALEPITPLVDRVRQLAALGVSTIMVVGGSGDYLDVADTIIAMHEYEPAAVTEAARRIAAEYPTARRSVAGPWRPPAERVPLPTSIDPSHGRREVAVKTWTVDRVQFGAEEVDLRAIAQIVERAQLRGIADALVAARGREIDGRSTLTDALRRLMDRIQDQGLASIEHHQAGELASFRIFELAAFLNRLRSLETVSRETSVE